MRTTGVRVIREQSGFTLPEMLVTIMVMLMVLFALYNVFDASMRVFTFGNDKVEAVDNARLGMEKMAREVRAAYALDKANNKPFLFWTSAYPNSPSSAGMPTTTRITFGNDNSDSSSTDGNRKIEPSEEITYRLSSTGPPYTVQRVSKGVASPVVEFVKAGGLSLTYLKKDGTALTPGELANSSNERSIAIVRIQIVVDVNGRSQTLTTDVALRNRD